MLDQLGFLPTKFSEVEPLALGALLGGLGSSNSLRPVRAAGQAKASGKPGKGRPSQGTKASQQWAEYNREQTGNTQS